MIRKFLRNKRQLLESTVDTTTIDRSEIISSDFFSPIKDIKRETSVEDRFVLNGKEKLEELISINGEFKKYILHNEDFFDAIFFDGYKEIIDYLANSASDYDVKFVLYVREQVTYLESWYMQQVHTGKAVSFDDYWHNIREKDFDWLSVVDAASARFGKENIIIKPYESITNIGSRGYLEDFLRSTCGIVNIGEYDVESQNRSFSSIAMEMALYFYPKINDEEKKVLRGFLQKNFSTRTHKRPTLMSDEQRDEVRSLYKDRNRILFENYMCNHNGGDLGYY